MRVILITLLALGACTRPPVAVMPVKYAAEMFQCADDPGPWPKGADDTVVAANIRQGRGAGKHCRERLAAACRSLAVNNQVVGECPRPREGVSRGQAESSGGPGDQAED